MLVNFNPCAQAMTTPSHTPMDKRLETFLAGQSVLTLAKAVDNQPHCAPCYYAYIPKEHLLVFKSDLDTQHIENALQNHRVAGSILPDKLEKMRTIGVQFTGRFLLPEGLLKSMAENAYLAKFPFATLFRGKIWVIELEKVKFTDNTPVIGKKILWER